MFLPALGSFEYGLGLDYLMGSCEVVVNPWKWLFPLLLVVGLAWAGADTTLAPTDREQVLRQRVQEYWSALIKKDLNTAYLFEAPVYRAAYSLERYQREFGRDVVWETAVVDHVLFEGDEVATVYVNVQYQQAALIAGEAPRFSTLLAEKWIHSDGQWWHVPRSAKSL